MAFTTIMLVLDTINYEKAVEFIKIINFKIDC